MSTTRAASRRSGGDHFNLGALSQRVFSTEERVGNLETKIGELDRAMGAGFDRISSELSSRIEKVAAKPTNPLQLIGTAVSIITLLGTVIFYVKSETDSQISTVNKTLDHEVQERENNTQRIYSSLSDGFSRAWSRDAQIEFEKRIEDHETMQNGFLKENRERYDREIAELKTIIVPRFEHDAMWRAQSDSLTRLAEHLNGSDQRYDSRMAEIEKSIHGFGISDEVKSLEGRYESVLSKLFSLVIPTEVKKPDTN